MKLKQLIDENSLLSHLEVAKNFKDASGILLAQHLTKVDPKIFARLYPDNVFLNSGLTIDNTGGLADTIKKIKFANLTKIQPIYEAIHSEQIFFTHYHIHNLGFFFYPH